MNTTIVQRGIRKVLARSLPITLAILLAAPPFPRAQQPGPAAAPFKPEELEQIVAPIALYPDPLVAQIFMASTYPVEVIQAARFAKANPNLKDAALNEELKKQTWDDSVKALVGFPQVLEMMDSQLEWMQKLGDAILAQQKETMDAIQRLRAKAQTAGNLKSTEQQKVIVERAEGQPQQQTIIKIEPANPEVIYVPTYNPTVVYGAWPYPAYPPYYYYPPYYPVGYWAATAAISFGIGMAVGGAIWGGCNWGGGDIDIDVNRQNNFSRNVNRGDRVNQLKTERGSGTRGDRGSWQHSPEHRKGAQYRDSATQQKFNRGGDSARAASRESFRGRAEQGRQEIGRGGAGQSAARSREGGVGSAGGGQRAAGGVGQGGAGTARGREGAIGSGAGGQRGSAGGGRAFEGVGQGQSQRSYSQRGESSRGSSYSGGGSRGGGGGFSGGGGGRGGGCGRGGGRR
jgi:Protein of unknown function (DUF3300)